MKKVKVKFTKKFAGFKKGDTATYTPAFASKLVSQGSALLLDEEVADIKGAKKKEIEEAVKAKVMDNLEKQYFVEYEAQILKEIEDEKQEELTLEVKKRIVERLTVELDFGEDLK